MIPALISSFLSSTAAQVAALLATVLVWGFRFIGKKIVATKEHDLASEKGILELLRYRLRTNCERYLNRGCITYDELEDTTRLFDAYVGMGGNSSLVALFGQVEKLPTCPCRNYENGGKLNEN